MDVRMHGNPRLHHMLNGYRRTKEDGLQFLSTEEKECLRFFENTIDSLEEGFDDDATGLSSKRISKAEDVQTLSSSGLSYIHATNTPSSIMEHDIIDLVHSPSSFIMPDFRTLAVTPKAHDDMKLRRDPLESSALVTPTSLDASEDNGYQPPPGSIPTPVVIASKISEHQGTGGVSPSMLIDRRRSMESKREQPIPAKPSNLPSNINMSRCARDVNPHSISIAAVNHQERRSQMLANLPAGSHPLEGGEPACVRNGSMRSVSFKDQQADKSRMEALSKLGLSKEKPTSPTSSYVPKLSSNAVMPNSSATSATSYPNKVISNAISTNYGANKVGSSNAPPSNYGPNMIINKNRNSSLSVTHSNPGSYETKFKKEISTNNFNSFGGKTAVIQPATKDTVAPANQERRSSTTPASADVSNADFNIYGGKSTKLIPTTSIKSESVPGARTSLITPEPADIKLNSYGGRSRVINPAPTDVPDGLYYTPAYSPPAFTSTTHQSDPSRSRINPLELKLNSYDAKPKVLSPSQPDSIYQPVVRSRPATLPSSTPRSECPTGSPRPRPEPVPQEILNKPAPSFRSQSVTVQFSGKGTTVEARQDALRRLGLLKKTS